MSRRHQAEKREILPDPKFGDIVVSKFMNTLMYEGKKSVAENIVYGAFDRLRNRTGADPLKVFHDALENVRPHLEVRSRRVGGATYQVPLEVAPERSESLAMRWLVGYARNRKGTPMHVALANEIKDAANNQGAAVRKRDDVHKMAQANRAFAHFRW